MPSSLSSLFVYTFWIFLFVHSIEKVSDASATELSTPSMATSMGSSSLGSRQSTSLQPIKSWRKLESVPLCTAMATDKLPPVKYFQLRTDNGSIACLVVMDLKSTAWQLKPFFYKKTGTTSSAARLHQAIVAINGGYFNLSNSESTSYVTINGKIQCEPKHNKALVENPKLKPYLSQIFNRTELRVLQDAYGSTRVVICNHNDPPSFHCPAQFKLIDSLQAGPRLLPELTDKAEAFVRTNSDGTVSDAIGSYRKAARTAFGISKDGHAFLLCIAGKGQEEFSGGVTLAELADILKKLGCSEAVNLDGGTSTTMVIATKNDLATKTAQNSTASDTKASNINDVHNGKDNSTNECVQVCGKTPEKLIKSGLMIIPVSHSRTSLPN